MSWLEVNWVKNALKLEELHFRYLLQSTVLAQLIDTMIEIIELKFTLGLQKIIMKRYVKGKLSILILYLISQVLASTIQSVNPLQFTNATGSCFGSSPLNTFLNLLNQASRNYRSNYQLNLQYLQSNMEAAFATQQEHYNIFIQDNSQYDSAYLIHPAGDQGCNYLSLFEGYNLINPKWSYLIVKNKYANSVLSFEYVGQLSQGSGIYQQKKQLINSIIYAMQSKLFSCLCSGLSTIANNIKKEDGQNWTIICQTGKFTHSYFTAKDHQWIYTQPVECAYLLYVQ